MDEIKILVVEDEAITAMDIQNRLQKLGYIVPAIVDTGEEAIAAALKLHPDLILMDVVLKGEMDGTVAAQRITNLSHIPIVFLTAYNDSNTVNRAKPSLPYGYITKPFGINELRIAVELALYKFKMEVESNLEATRLKNEFLANMTHEIRTPLNGIIGFAEMLQSGSFGALTPEQKEVLSDVLISGNFLSQLLGDILDLTQAQTKKLEFHPEPINLTKLVRDVVALHQDDISKIKNKLIIKLDPSLTDIVIDLENLKKVLHHFLANAIKFSTENQIIEICASPENKEQFRLAVKDSGIGIRPEKLKELFVPFAQIDASMSKKFQGAGVGLALVKKIVEAQNGKVGVESIEAKGSEFYAILQRRN